MRSSKSSRTASQQRLKHHQHQRGHHQQSLPRAPSRLSKRQRSTSWTPSSMTSLPVTQHTTLHHQRPSGRSMTASVILAEGVDITAAMGDYNLITLIEYMKQTSVDKSNTPWDLSHQQDPISVLTVLDNHHYEKFIRTGSIILEGIDQSMPYVHHHPHLFQSPLAAINFCIVDHALHRISGEAKNHESLVLIHLKLEPASLIASNTLMAFSRPSHPDQELEHLMDHFPNISKYARTSCCLQGPPSSFIKELISSEGLPSTTCLTIAASMVPTI